MSRSKNRPDIETLLSDRARFEAWLDQLMAKASQMPPHVVDRVRGDYEQRLAAVVEDLRSRADDLHAEARSLEERLAVLDGELGSKRDARAEDELRALVGEYGEEEWQAKAAEHDEMIGRFDTDRSARVADLSRIRDLLDQATRPSRAMRAISAADIPDEPTPVTIPAVAPPEPQPDPEPVQAALDFVEVTEVTVSVEAARAEVENPQGDSVEAHSEAAEPQAASPVTAEPPVAPRVSSAVPVQAVPGVPPVPSVPPVPLPEPGVPEPSRRPSPFDEIGFLRTVVGRATPYAGVELTANGPVAPSPEAAPRRVSAAIEAAAPPPPPPPPPAVVTPPVPRSTIPNFQPPTIPDVAPPPRGPSQSMPMFGDPVTPDVSSGAAEPDISARLSKGTTEVARSLKCQECGWMNYPTEWYCEKCGGELAAF